MKNELTVGFAGMTHLGICHSVGCASLGIKTIGYDEDNVLIGNLESGDFEVSEPDLLELFKNNRDNIFFSANSVELEKCDIVFISSDVPTDSKGESSLDTIYNLIDKVSSKLSKSALLVILCQVPPGFSRRISFPKDRLFYQVETLIFGRAMERVLQPERFIVGCDDVHDDFPVIYEQYLRRFECPILVMRYESAELAKISINFFLVSSVTTANILAEVCEKIGADWNEIVPALQLDKRIGEYAYLKPGLGISGGNLERDLATILKISEEKGTHNSVIKEWVANSKYRKNWLSNCFRNEVLPNFSNEIIDICLLGLAYKENTHSTKNSPSINFILELKDLNVRIRTHDPRVQNTKLPNYCSRLKNIQECIHNADVLVIGTPWGEYKKISVEYLTESMNGKFVIDPYQVLDGDSLIKIGIKYFTLGK